MDTPGVGGGRPSSSTSMGQSLRPEVGQLNVYNRPLLELEGIHASMKSSTDIRRSSCCSSARSLESPCKKLCLEKKASNSFWWLTNGRDDQPVRRSNISASNSDDDMGIETTSAPEVQFTTLSANKPKSDPSSLRSCVRPPRLSLSE